MKTLLLWIELNVQISQGSAPPESDLRRDEV